jgi:hypothetical protein
MQYAVFDIESNHWIDFAVLGFFDGQDYRTFESPGAFLDALDSKAYKGFWIYAHNGGKFDFMFLLDELFERGWIEKIIERGGRMLAIRVDTGTTRFTLCDSYALLTASLQALSDSFKPPHPKIKLPPGKSVDEGFDRTDPEQMQYLENDCLCLYEILGMFRANDYIAQPQLTIASQAMNTFREIFVPCKLQKITLQDEDYFREHFYTGGRVEVYKGSGRVNCYDVNSLYPFAMLSEMPCGKLEHTTRYVPGKIGFYTVQVKNAPELYLSPFLAKGKLRGVKGSAKNYYVNGPGLYHMSSDSLEYIKKELGVRAQVVRGFVFSRRDDLFTNYVETFFKLKSQSERGSANYVIAKLFLTSLYGKFGQARWQETLQRADGYTEGSSLCDNPFLDRYGLVLVKEKSGSRFILPYIAAYITDRARLYHYQLMMRAPESMFYCDTDSLFTSADYSDKVSPAIGDLSFDGAWDGVFLNAKTYALRSGDKEKIAFKGFGTDRFSFSDMERALHTQGMTLDESRERILSFRECLSRLQPGFAGKQHIVHSSGRFLNLVERQKKAVTTYDKRLTFTDQKHTFDSKPHLFSSITQ